MVDVASMHPEYSPTKTPQCLRSLKPPDDESKEQSTNIIRFAKPLVLVLSLEDSYI